MGNRSWQTGRTIPFHVEVPMISVWNPSLFRRLATLVLATLCCVSCSSPDMPSDPTTLETDLHAVLTTVPEAEVSVAWRDLKTRRTHLYHANLVMHAASTMKVAVMIEAFRRIDSGDWTLDRELPVHATFKSILDGSPYTLTPTDDSEPTLYEAIGQTRPVLHLIELMMQSSSNLATNLLIDELQTTKVQETIDNLGVTRMRVLRGVQDIPAFEAGMSNVTTARDLMRLMEAIAENNAASPDSCQRMREILLAQHFNTMIPAGLPEGTPVAHKTGSITKIHHDAAIVYPEEGAPYILVVMIRGVADREVSSRLAAEISRTIWGHR